MPKYLNSQEKSIALTIAAFISYMDDRAEEWAKIGRPKEQIKYTKTAKSFAQKVLDIMFRGLDKDEVAKVLKELGKMQVVTKYNTEAIREQEEIRKFESITAVETQDLLDIIQLALASCSVCEDPGEECEYKKLFIKYDIEPQNIDPKHGGCPYRKG